jgi:hypothetical protein
MVRIVLTVDADVNCDDASHFATRRCACFESSFVAHVAVALRPRVIGVTDRNLAKRTYALTTRREPFRFLKRQA